jgi:hypothetical protein
MLSGSMMHFVEEINIEKGLQKDSHGTPVDHGFPQSCGRFCVFVLNVTFAYAFSLCDTFLARADIT